MLIVIKRKATKEEMRNKVLDIAMNLNRIGNWAADDLTEKKKRIDFFLDQTTRHIESLDTLLFSKRFKTTFNQFVKEYNTVIENRNSKDSLAWAEKLMTWGNILTHRSKLI